MAPKNEEFIIPNYPNTMGNIEIASSYTNPDQIELAVEALDRQRILKEIFVISSDIHNARSSDIDKRLHDFHSDKVKRVINSLISGDINFSGRNIDEMRDRITRSVMDQEVAIGSMIFEGSDIEGDHTVFVSHDRVDEIFWHFSLDQPEADPTTVRYVIREGQAYKSIDGSPFMDVDDQELSNLHSSVKMIHYIASRGLYKDSIRSDFGLAA